MPFKDKDLEKLSQQIIQRATTRYSGLPQNIYSSVADKIKRAISKKETLPR